ncbi:unnamed protein product [Ranitomeya imitator]|uniref:PiggyBac transposable element-derived protein domain-containing protein n=1 Tax=Ranitomeya imitator TaxID=111125 RepID=A0ABN9LXN7_9NEOB|nr:unnamed protein product [Ranitomeya imitator]
MLVVKDKRDVLFLTTKHGDGSTPTAVQGTSTHVTKPDSILWYNKNMGGVDLSDKVLQPYSAMSKTKEWYRILAVHIVQIAMYNFFTMGRSDRYVPSVPGGQTKYASAGAVAGSKEEDVIVEDRRRRTATPIGPNQDRPWSVSGNIALYSCSIYDVSHSVIGRFDGMWDRGAFVAVNPKDRERYANVILSLMAKDCRYLLVTVEYDPKLHRGPPFYVPESDLENFLGPSCTFKLLKKIDALTDKQKQWGLDLYFENLYLITPKLES